MGESSSVHEMWDAFVVAHPGAASHSSRYTAWHFCDNQPDADELAELVLAGRKQATAGALWAYEDEGEELPLVGDYSVITDWNGTAQCVIQATTVEVVPFDEVSAEFAAREGEGDGSLEYWKDVHGAAFAREFEGTERIPSSDMPVVCQEFRVVFP